MVSSSESEDWSGSGSGDDGSKSFEWSSTSSFEETSSQSSCIVLPYAFGIWSWLLLVLCTIDVSVMTHISTFVIVVVCSKTSGAFTYVVMFPCKTFCVYINASEFDSSSSFVGTYTSFAKASMLKSNLLWK